MYRTAAIAGAVGLSLAAGALAQQTFTIPLAVDFDDPQYAPFHEAVEGQLDGVIVDGQLVAEPDSDPGNCRVSVWTLGGEGAGAVYVDVDAQVRSDRGDGTLMAGAGLVIRHSREDGVRFLAFLATDDGYDIVAFDNGAIGQRIQSTLTDLDEDGTLHLAARDTGQGAEFFVNGRNVGSLSDSRITGTGLGLLHCGSGRYVFDNWGLNMRGDVGFDITAGAG